uniref:Uncharacterized protein n=1 Tax=Cyprinus carpio TaxID=7962 RepID=A0A8C1ZL93_CYPCA
MQIGSVLNHVFCVPSRTATVWKNLNPFWGEEYTLHLPMGFHTLTFYVMDEDNIGFLAECFDNWLNLTRVDPDQEVQGEIRLALELHRDAQRSSLHCHVIEARDLAPRDISGTSDPFTRIIYNNLSAETSVRSSSVSMHTHCIDCVCLWVVQVEIPLSCLHRSPPLQGWFRLLPLGNTEDDASGELGALRLKVRLAEDRILPSVCYQPLIKLLVEAVISPSKVDEPSPLTLLEEVTTAESRQDVAMTLVKIYLGQGLVVPFLDYLNTREVHSTTDPNTLFRSNSLASKAMEQFMKAVGMLYLHEVLKPIINRIFEERKYVELDPCKIDLSCSRRISFKGLASEAEVRESSVGLLQTYLSSIMEAIVSSVSQCPPVMRVVFKQLRKRVEEQFIIFFIPHLTFILFSFQSSIHTFITRMFLLQALQSVGNLGLQLGHGKEQWMTPLHPSILCSVVSVKDFLDKLIDIDHDNEKNLVRSYISIASVCAVERVDEHAFQLQNVMQVITQDTDGELHTTYLQCKVTRNTHTAYILNSDLIRSQWTVFSSSGCSRTHSAVTLGDWSDPLDPDAETQIIYKELLQGRDKLRFLVNDKNLKLGIIFYVQNIYLFIYLFTYLSPIFWTILMTFTMLLQLLI